MNEDDPLALFKGLACGLVITALLLFSATKVFAQQAPDSLALDVVNNFQAEQIMHGNTTKAMNAVLEAYGKLLQENTKLKADLAAKEPAKEQ